MSINIPNFSQTTVLVVGDLMLDRYWSGKAHRVSQEAPVPIVNVSAKEDRLGGAANVAKNMAALGVNVIAMGYKGNDHDGEILENCLQSFGIQSELVKQTQYPTITKLRILSQQQQLLRLDFEQRMNELNHDELLNRFCEQVKNVDMVILSDYNKGTLDCVEQLITIAKENGKPVLIDPIGSDYSRYKNADLIKPNFHEFEMVAGECNSEDQVLAKGRELIQSLNLQSLLITRSEKGMTLLEQEKAPEHFAALAREVYDVTGAGDTVISVLAASLAAGSSLVNATLLANLASGLVVAKVGTASVSVAELRRELRHNYLGHSALVDETELKDLVLEAQSNGEKIVMTNGCFDILHPGHVSYLKEAKQLGDRLIVAVNSDASVKALKGPTRPINDVDHRMEVLAGLEAVDWVVEFDQETPQQLIANILPNLLVKGGDYQVEQIAGAKEVFDNGGDVKILSFKNGFSTTAIIEQMNQQDKK